MKIKTVRSQRGIAVILLAILIGISVVSITSVVAYSYYTKKESNVAGHAQVNSQMLAWAGVSAFREYLVEKGSDDINEVRALAGTTISLKNEHGKLIEIHQIRILGCADDNDDCQVEANVTGENTTAKSAVTINTLFDINLDINGDVTGTGAGTFGGGLALEGRLEAEKPNSVINLNVDGNLTIGATARAKNIKELNINQCNGDIKINCSLVASESFCKIPKINIYSCGSIKIDDKAKFGNFGKLYAKGNVILEGAQAGDIFALKDVDTSWGSHAGNISAGRNVKVWAVKRDDSKHQAAGGEDAEDLGEYDDDEIDTDIDTGIDDELADDGGSVNENNISGSTTGNIKAGGNVSLSGAGATAIRITANGNVVLWTGAGKESLNIASGGKTDIHTSSKAGNVQANGSVYVGGVNAKASDITSNSWVRIRAGGAVDNIAAKQYVRLQAQTRISGNVIALGEAEYMSAGVITSFYPNEIKGNIYSKKDIKFTEGGAGAEGVWVFVWTGGFLGGNAYTYGIVKNGLNIQSTGARGKFKNGDRDAVDGAITGIQWPVAVPLDAETMKEEIEAVIDARTEGLKSYVSAKVYKYEANYIFSSNGVKRVFLNKLKNLANGELYITKNVNGVDKQYIVIDDEEKLLNDGEAFYIGEYTLNGQRYIGAICKFATNNICDNTGDNVIGYLPRISLEENARPKRDVNNFGDWLENITEEITTSIINIFTNSTNMDYEFTGSKYIVSSVIEQSSVQNAVLAPGIMYFDGDLAIRGHGMSISNGADGSAFVNSFLAEGDIVVAAFSPNIISPYNSVRNFDGLVADESIVCSRDLQKMNGSYMGVAPDTTPETVSNKYLRPTNLCTSTGRFSKNMNFKEGTEVIDTVKISDNRVPKLDLGFVALMSEKSIHFMVCAQIYGDVLAKGAIRTSTGLVCGGGNKQTTTGSMTTETGHTGDENILANIFKTNINRIHAASKFVVADSQYTNFDASQPPQGNTGSGSNQAGDSYFIDEIKVKWFRIQ